MRLETIHSVYFLGIGGIGMSALARYFKQCGAVVSGYDKTPSPLTEQLVNEGIDVFYHEGVDAVPRADLYVFTPAIPADHPAFDHVVDLGYRWYKRSEVLQWITQQSRTIAIAGTHGKTTTTAITSHILHQNLPNVAAFVGGVMAGYDTNMLGCKNPEWVVVEADEYDRSFLRLSPEILVVTSLDPDHLDIYGTFDDMVRDYQKLIDSSKFVFIHEKIKDLIHCEHAILYGVSDDASIRAIDINAFDGQFTFASGETFFHSAMPGRHNVQNALAAIAIARHLELSDKQIADSLITFRGVKRRFEKVLSAGDKVIYDDYAHHPEEINAAIDAARELHPNSKLAVVFQPHLFSRTRDLEDDFVQSLSRADEVILLPIYPARELPIKGVSSANLLNRLSLKTKRLVEKPDLENAVLSLTAQIVLLLGAGDIDRMVEPLANAVKAHLMK